MMPVEAISTSFGSVLICFAVVAHMAMASSIPFWPVHVVVVPKRHVPSLLDLGGEEEALLAQVMAVVREERGRIRRYAHVGTGNSHTGTARIYEDLGVLTCQPEICEDVAAVFNQLTGATPPERFREIPEDRRQ